MEGATEGETAKTKTRSDQPKKRRNRKQLRSRILTLKERLLAIKAYYRKPVYSKIARKFKCDWAQIKTIIQERKAILDYYEMATAHFTTLTVEEMLLRRQKITLLGGCMYEYIQRAQYHKNATLEEKVLLAQAAEFSYILQIKNFIPTRTWLKQFKISYKIPLSDKQIQLNGIPPASLSPKKILAHCKKLVNLQNEPTKNNPQADSDSQSENITTSTKTSKTKTTDESESRKQRRRKINLLEKALYEFIQRAQYHRNTPLNEELHIQVACELNDMLKIENFTPNKNWIKHFKLHFNINTSQRKIVVNRIPPNSLNLNEILSYVSDMEAESSNASPTTRLKLEHEVAEIVEKVEENQQNQQPKIILNSTVQPETIMTLEFHNVGEVDIKPDISDIEIEFVEDDEEMEQPALKIQKIESMHVDKINKIREESAKSCGHSSGEEDIKPDTTDIEFEILNDADDEEVEQPVLQLQPFESIQVEQSTESQQRSVNEETPPKHMSNGCDQTEYIPTHSIDRSREKNITKLKDQVLVIEAYDQKRTFSKIAEEFNCTREEVKHIVRNRRNIMNSYDVETLNGMIKGQKVALLEDCMFEYMQRAKFHANVCLDEDTLIGRAIRFKEHLQIKNFTINKSWLNHFQSLINLPLYQQRKNLKRSPPYSLSTWHIILYCIREYTKQKTQMNSVSTKPTELIKTPGSATAQDELSVLRQHKIEILEEALYEYIQRSQYHRKMPLNENLQIKVARELESILKINDFSPNKNWLKHFKLHYNINTSQRMIVVNRIPPSSLDLKDILSYCRHIYGRNEVSTPKVISVEHSNLQEEEQKPHIQLKDQEPEQQIAVNLEVQPETEMTMKAKNADEEDIKPNVMDIKIELSEEQEAAQVQPACLRTSTEENYVHITTAMENENIDSLQTKQSSDDEVLPKVTKSYADALKKLKSLEEFSLLEENYRAIGLITQLENIFMNMLKCQNKNKKKM